VVSVSGNMCGHVAPEGEGRGRGGEGIWGATQTRECTSAHIPHPHTHTHLVGSDVTCGLPEFTLADEGGEAQGAQALVR